MTIRTHYNNLHLAPDASEAEIRQAYRRLSKQYHPDLNTDPDAHRIMQLINQAYEVLSDPKKRAEHDLWIAQQRMARAADAMANNRPVTPDVVLTPTEATPSATKSPKKYTGAIALAVLLLAVLLIGQIWFAAQSDNAPDTKKMQAALNASTPSSDNTPNDVNHEKQPALLASNPNENTVALAASVAYIRPFAAPNGNPFPQQAGYIDGYPIHTGQGGLRIYVENIRNSSDVFAQLYVSGNAEPLRTFFIPERSQLELQNLNAGSYTIRYQQLDGGEQLNSETVVLQGNQREATVYLQRGSAPVSY
ncbi:J domain-containing protein [Kingella kingae]|uniref:J domain-containing protein n=1 Tax=Kingella kingae TaxID=504 RepID=UPI0002585500|nr:J domain-containing protein [Kingella kingae]EIC14123.1 heat shock protein DnaJ domain-containing protein [Kingella kingae PYKK081]MBD3614371.1 J domain-containing protein [Kingella kingae]MBD3632637.1 J domain-containing protein [Kingella kingae]MBD3660030.1 J domain-containing protein [Kingella kingae]MDK4568146.1 J domain-containing protein [Kingella kingae]